MRILRAIGNGFILIGATLLLFVAYELVGTSIVTNRHQSALADAFDDSLRRLPPPVVSGSPPPPPSPAPRSYSGPAPIARIRIPKIGVNRIVVEGTTLPVLAYGPGHYKETPEIGDEGSAAIAGHRTGWSSPFINVDRLRRGDRVILETTEATYTYEVTRLTIVDPGDVWVLGGDPSSRATHKLTLTTCTPKYTSRDRLIVWADLVQTVARS